MRRRRTSKSARFHLLAVSHKGMTSKNSRDLANVRQQLRTEHTRGTNPRPLGVEDIQDLRRQRDKLLARKKEVAMERAVARIERHTTGEADRVVQAVQPDGLETRNVLQPLVTLVAGAEGTSIEDAEPEGQGG